MAASFSIDSKRRDYQLFDPKDLTVNRKFDSRQAPIARSRIRWMADNILEHTQLSPVIGRKTADKGVEIVAGLTRYAACLLLRESDPAFKIKVIVHEGLNDDDAYDLNLFDNLVRNALSPIDLCYAMHRYKDQRGWETGEIAKFFDFATSKVNNLMKLKGASRRVQKMVSNEEIAVDTAIHMIGLTDTQVDHLLEQSAERATAALAAEIRGEPEEKSTALVPLPKQTSFIESDNDGEAVDYDPMTGRPVSKKARAAAERAGKRKMKAGDVKELRRAGGEIIKRSLADLKKVLDGRPDDISRGIIDFLDGKSSPDELAELLQTAEVLMAETA